jgi:Protein similar to CwfJ C-terminus 2
MGCTHAQGLKGSIPDNFPYFFVEFGLSEGFVHVVDDVERFKPDFGRSVLAGLLKLPAEDAHTRGKPQSEGLQRLWVEDFLKDFRPYDWTKQLDE